MLFWTLLASVPTLHAENARCVRVWRTIFHALGHIRSGGSSVGRALADSDFPGRRMARLLAATWGTLPPQLTEAIRWVFARNNLQVDLSVPATLGLADALGDPSARDWARRRLALDYVKQRGRRQTNAA